MLPDRAIHALTPDGSVIPTDRTSDAWGGGTGPSAVGFAADGVTPITVPPSKVIRIDPATGIPGISPTAYVDQTAYNAARQRGDEPWQFTKPEVDVLIGAGLLQPDPNDPADLAGIYTELVDQHALIPAPWTAAINAAVDAGELNPDGTLPGSTPTETPAGAPPTPRRSIRSTAPPRSRPRLRLEPRRSGSMAGAAAARASATGLPLARAVAAIPVTPAAAGIRRRCRLTSCVARPRESDRIRGIIRCPIDTSRNSRAGRPVRAHHARGVAPAVACRPSTGDRAAAVVSRSSCPRG